MPPARKARLIGSAILLLGVGLLGGWSGWTWRDRTATPIVEEINVTVTRPVIEATPEVRVGVVPLIVGLDVESARQALIDAGVDPSDIVEVNVPYGGTPGLVITQSPLGGVQVGGEVSLEISTATVVPDLVGETTEAARSLMNDLGVRVVLSYRYVPGTSSDTVLSSVPAAGEPLGDSLEVQVSARASSVYLADLEPINRDCSTSDISVNAVVLTSSLACRPSYENIYSNEYLLSRLADELVMTIGIDDRCEEPIPMVFRVFLDGTKYAEWVMEYGSSRELRVPVTGVLRVRLEVARADGLDEYNDCYAVWGSASVTGGQQQIDQLLAES